MVNFVEHEITFTTTILISYFVLFFLNKWCKRYANGVLRNSTKKSYPKFCACTRKCKMELTQIARLLSKKFAKMVSRWQIYPIQLYINQNGEFEMLKRNAVAPVEYCPLIFDSWSCFNSTPPGKQSLVLFQLYPSR